MAEKAACKDDPATVNIIIVGTNTTQFPSSSSSSSSLSQTQASSHHHHAPEQRQATSHHHLESLYPATCATHKRISLPNKLQSKHRWYQPCDWSLGS
eukprot:3932689-Rhodomonas_salina.1